LMKTMDTDMAKDTHIDMNGNIIAIIVNLSFWKIENPQIAGFPSNMPSIIAVLMRVVLRSSFLGFRVSVPRNGYLLAEDTGTRSFNVEARHRHNGKAVFLFCMQIFDGLTMLLAKQIIWGQSILCTLLLSTRVLSTCSLNFSSYW